MTSTNDFHSNSRSHFHLDHLYRLDHLCRHDNRHDLVYDGDDRVSLYQTQSKLTSVSSQKKTDYRRRTMFWLMFSFFFTWQNHLIKEKNESHQKIYLHEAQLYNSENYISVMQYVETKSRLKDLSFSNSNVGYKIWYENQGKTIKAENST